MRQLVCVCKTYMGKPISTRVVPQFTTEVAKPLTQAVSVYSLLFIVRLHNP
jgi:hypothetical protein